MGTEQSKISIIIADDHLLFADGVEQILMGDPAFEVLAKADNGKLLLQMLNRLRPNLILMDINMPYLSGIEAAESIKKNLPEVKIVFLSMYHDTKMLMHAKQSGINGFIIKNTTALELKDAIRRVMDGEKVFIVPPQPQQTENKQDDKFLKRFKLSPREIEIIHHIKQGKTTKEIAEIVFLSSLTIETHRKNIFRKLQISNMAQLLSFAAENGI